jgi:protease I
MVSGLEAEFYYSILTKPYFSIFPGGLMRYSLVLSMLVFVMCGSGKDDSHGDIEHPDEIKLVKSILIVIAPENFRDEEFKEPNELFTKSGAKISIASTDTLPAKGMLGMIVKPDIRFEQVVVDSFDVLIVVGGTGCKSLWDNKMLHSIVGKFNEANKTIAAICIAPVVLARAGILKDIEVTAFPSVKDDINKCGGCFLETEIAVCNNIITGSGPKAAKAFAETILSEIAE